ncbi:hypothetical protein [Streptomyces sp. NPDC057199]|uniref:hypothetical protein n=1 Tax=Streptomyces sp. NPDC057199 TaxID=3346047 RepID=UPI0036279B59
MTALLARLGTDDEPLDHATLDEHGASGDIQHLRSVLVTAGALPPRDEHFLALERTLAHLIATLSHPDDRTLLQAFAQWDRIGRLRRRLAGRILTNGQAQGIFVQVKEAGRLLVWLRSRSTDLRQCDQGEIDLWIADGKSVHQHARAFVKWAVANRHARGIEVPVPPRAQPSPPLETDTRVEIAQRLLTDTTVALDLRIAGLLVLLFAQPVTTVAKLRVDQVVATDTGLHLHLGSDLLHLPGTLAALVDELVASPSPHAAVGRNRPSPYLFPGRFPEQPRSPQVLRARLKKLGIHGRPAQHFALRDLGQELPQTVINRLLGISITSVDRWKADSRWATYAASVAGRIGSKR